MKDHIDAADRLAADRWLAQVTLDELDTPLDRGEVLGVAGGQIIHDADVVTQADQSLGQVRADESGATRDETVPKRSSLSSVRHTLLF